MDKSTYRKHRPRGPMLWKSNNRARISAHSSSSVRHAHATPPEYWNGVDYRLLVQDYLIAKLQIEPNQNHLLKNLEGSIFAWLVGRLSVTLLTFWCYSGLGRCSSCPSRPLIGPQITWSVLGLSLDDGWWMKDNGWWMMDDGWWMMECRNVGMKECRIVGM